MKKVKAHIVLPVGLKANLSETVVGSKAGNNHLLTTNFSARRYRIGVTEMGLNSEIGRFRYFGNRGYR